MVHWLCCAYQILCSSIVGLVSFQVYLIRLSDWEAPGATLSSRLGNDSGDDSAPLLGQWQIRLEVWQRALHLKPESGRSIPHHGFWSDCTTILALEMRKTAGWGYNLGPAGRNLVGHYLDAVCCHFFLTIRFPVVQSCRYPCNPHAARLRGVSQEGTLYWEFFGVDCLFLLEELQAQGRS